MKNGKMDTPPWMDTWLRIRHDLDLPLAALRKHGFAKLMRLSHEHVDPFLKALNDAAWYGERFVMEAAGGEIAIVRHFDEPYDI